MNALPKRGKKNLKKFLRLIFVALFFLWLAKPYKTRFRTGFKYVFWDACWE